MYTFSGEANLPYSCFASLLSGGQLLKDQMIPVIEDSISVGLVAQGLVVKKPLTYLVNKTLNFQT